MKTFDTESIRAMNLFENLTGVQVIDCVIEGNVIYLVVEEGKMGFAIGKNGSIIRRVERALGRPIKIFEHSKELQKFVKNLIPQAQEIKIQQGRVEVKVDKTLRPVVIGRDSKNLKILKKILHRNFKVEDLVIR